MNPALSAEWGDPAATAVIRTEPEDFLVEEQLGFEPEGSGEHLFLFVQKRACDTFELIDRVAQCAGVAVRDIGYSGLKDKHAVTRQWISVGLAGRPVPQWGALEADGTVRVERAEWHPRKLRRGVHKGNRFSLLLRKLSGDKDALEERMRALRMRGIPNYFGPQRFGNRGSTLRGAKSWSLRRSRISRRRRSLYLSAMRGAVFNSLLAERLRADRWLDVEQGDVCLLAGTQSFFCAEGIDPEIEARILSGDIHPGLPLWGRNTDHRVQAQLDKLESALESFHIECKALVEEGLVVAWRPVRSMPDDFLWEFCDDGLRLDFTLDRGSYATALLAQLVEYADASGSQV